MKKSTFFLYSKESKAWSPTISWPSYRLKLLDYLIVTGSKWLCVQFSLEGIYLAIKFNTADRSPVWQSLPSKRLLSICSRRASFTKCCTKTDWITLVNQICDYYYNHVLHTVQTIINSFTHLIDSKIETKHHIKNDFTLLAWSCTLRFHKPHLWALMFPIINIFIKNDKQR